MFGVLRVPKTKLQVIGRFDSIDPNTDADNDRTSRIIAGVAYQLSGNLRVLADIDHVVWRTTPALEARSLAGALPGAVHFLRSSYVSQALDGRTGLCRPGLQSRGPAGPGAGAHGAATGVLAIGAETDQFGTIPELQKCLLSSAMKNVKGAVHDALVRIASDAFQAGFHSDNAATGGVALAPFHDFDSQVPQAVKDLLATTLAGLADGSIKTGVTVDGTTEVPASGPTS